MERRIVTTYNPFRYRGYYYDVETQWYYLQTRYYNPNWGRFISADGYVNANGDIIGFNMYAYCSNNPVMGYDPSGEWSWGGWLIQAGALVVSYVTTAVVAIFDEDVREDMNRINWNPFNADEEAVLESSKISFYKGQCVIREDWEFTDDRSGSFVFMFLNSDAYDEETVKHEWGHFVQFSRMSPITYLTCIGIPSALSEGDDYKYYSNPWEITADLFGGVDRASVYKPGSLAWGVGLFIAPLPVVIAYSLIE